MDAVRIIVAEDNALTREMIVECIAAERDLRVIGAAANGLEALNYLRQEDADVLIERVCSKGGTTIEAVNHLKDHDFYQLIDQTMAECTRRALELKK